MNWQRLGGEFAFIGRVVERLEPSANEAGGFRLRHGIGDDAAVLETETGTLLWTTDMLVEGVHFRLELCDPYRLGWKALAVNLSDIAAMGGQPTFALFACAFPPKRLNEWAGALVDGLIACARQYGVTLVGGDTNRAPQVVLNVDVLGRAVYPPALRSTAHPGDRLLVTGSLGGSRAGLERLLTDGLQKAQERDAEAVEAHLKPIPRLPEGSLAVQHGASAMIDLSDGLGGDLLKLCEASGCGAIIKKEVLPLHPTVFRLAQERNFDPYLFALIGGEDYELLIAAPSASVQELRQAIESNTGTPVTEIGVLTEDPSLWMEDPRGHQEPLPGGWDHFENG